MCDTHTRKKHLSISLVEIRERTQQTTHFARDDFVYSAETATDPAIVAMECE